MSEETRERHRSSWRTAALLAVGGGVAWGLCFGRETSPWLPWLAFAPLVLLLAADLRRPVLWGWLHGIVTWLVSMSWIAATLETYGGLPWPVAAVLLVLLAIYLGFDHALFVFLGRRIWRAGGVTPLWALPALWVVLEGWRGFFFGGFPWNLAAYSWVDLPGALPLSAWIGAFGVSYLLIFANVSLAWAVKRRSGSPAVLAVLLPMLVLGMAGRFGAVRDSGASARPAREVRAREVRVVQPDSPIVSDPAMMNENYRRLITLSRNACLSEPGSGSGAGPLVVWPESAAWPWSWARTAQVRREVANLNALGCEVLLGSATGQGQEVFNSALLVSDGEAKGTYSKRRLVPFGEYVPLGEILPFVGTLARQAGSFTAGDSVALLPWGEERLGAAICYEIVFGAAVAEQVRAGATVLVTITNDAWYGDTAASWQHFRAARFRAAESRRPVLRAALTGVSGLIDARGAVFAQLEVGEQGVLEGRVTGSDELTLYSRAPLLVQLLCLLGAAFAIVRGWRRRPPPDFRD